MKLIFLLLIATVLFQGCSAVHPATQEYTILPTYTAEAKTANGINATLKLTTTRSIASLASTQFYYLKEASNIDAYLYSRWSDTPSSMIDRALYASLQKQHLFETLIPSTSSAVSDLTLESELNAFYHHFHNDSSSEGLIDITYRLIDNKTKKTIASKRFIITHPSPSEDAKGGVVALNTATHELSNQCVKWIEMTLKESSWIK
jgi:ABC-type uncharacterized transport system auxiliary subunit